MSSDVRDVLDLPKEPTVKHVAKKIKIDGPKRMEGMQRELYSLLGENTPPISITDNKFRDKPNWRQKATPWTWSAFKNRARTDDLTLYHWVRGTQAEDEEYSFAKLNQKIQVPQFDRTDYEEALTDARWTYEETRYLFDLCRDYDLRWVVVHDRYNWKKEDGDDSMPVDETTDGRTIEDVKERYYSVCRALLKLSHTRAGTTLSPADEDVYKQMKFSKENELKRKAHLEKLLTRSPAEVAEEEALVIESRKLEAAAEQMLKERAEILRLLDAPQASGSIAQYQVSQGLAQLTTSLLTTEKTRKRRDSGQSTPDLVQTESPTAAPALSTKVVKPEQPKKTAATAVAQLVQKKLSAKEEAAFGITYHEKLTPGVYLRSTKMVTLKQAIAQKVSGALNEMGLPSKPVMATAKVCAKFESLQQSIRVLLEAKRQLDKLDTEVKILRVQQ
jgi:DNA methyltransferase 1-associated protein 1